MTTSWHGRASWVRERRGGERLGSGAVATSLSASTVASCRRPMSQPWLTVVVTAPRRGGEVIPRCWSLSHALVPIISQNSDDHRRDAHEEHRNTHTNTSGSWAVKRCSIFYLCLFIYSVLTASGRRRDAPAGLATIRNRRAIPRLPYHGTRPAHDESEPTTPTT